MFPLGDLFDRQVTLRWGQANVRRWSDGLLEMLRDGDPFGASGLTTQEVPLAEAPDYHGRFQKKEEGVLKVVLRP